MSRFCLLFDVNLSIDYGRHFSTKEKTIYSIDILVFIRWSYNFIWIRISPDIICRIYCHHVVRIHSSELIIHDLHSISNNQRLQRLVVGRLQIFKSFSGPVEPIMNYASTQKTYGMRNNYGELNLTIWLKNSRKTLIFFFRFFLKNVSMMMKMIREEWLIIMHPLDNKECQWIIILQHLV